MSGKLNWGKHNKQAKAHSQGTEYVYSGLSKVTFADDPTRKDNFTPCKASLVTAEIVALKDLDRLTVKNRQDLKRFLTEAEDSDRWHGITIIFECENDVQARDIDQAFQYAIRQNEFLGDVFAKYKKSCTRS